MREIVIVIRDLYLEPELAARPEPSASALQAPALAAVSSTSGGSIGAGGAPGIESLARLGDKTTLPAGWRAWVAQWLGLPQFVREAPASIAAAGLAQPPADRAVWLATPLHLIAGLTSLHFDRRSVLYLPRPELATLAAGFRETFRGSGFELHPLDGGEFLLSGPPIAAPTTTTEPARMVLTSVADALPSGEGSPALRRLSAEIEMWLHGHAVNGERARRGAPPVAALWLWGGGAPPASSPAPTSSPAPASTPVPASGLPPARELMAAAFGSDAYVRGLWRLAGGETRPMPVDWTAVLGEPRAQRALGVVEVAELLHADASWTVADAVANIDRRLISPSLAALRRGELERLTVLANDRRLSLSAADRWRVWRRMRGARRGIEGLT